VGSAAGSMENPVVTWCGWVMGDIFAESITTALERWYSKIYIAAQEPTRTPLINIILAAHIMNTGRRRRANLSSEEDYLLLVVILLFLVLLEWVLLGECYCTGESLGFVCAGCTTIQRQQSPPD